ncbi:hypothetical protein COF75_07565 [Bacillus toyonensis]|uniref:hypothetical protein n=1 Tax=Bacillus toyonensis TaxID=155322 RepID=UPI000BF2018C|nr:hypothetical protein [Bacillus toyonensis]PEL23455.1 hypothetical protein CN624_21030 [Bacillus toyonensis]PHD51899.1 hypothetical protein COF75_07565 [Bacillus toyonensis]
MFGLFNKKNKPKRGIKFRLNGVDFICVGMNASSVEMAIIQRAKLVYAKNKLDGRTHGINPRWVADYVKIEYYEDGTWEVV